MTGRRGRLPRTWRCECEAGCPTCVGPPMEVGETGKDGVIKLCQYTLAVAEV